VGLKFVRKRPPVGGAAGYKPMLKAYMAGTNEPDYKGLKKAMKSNFAVGNYCYDTGLTMSGKWLAKHDMPGCGDLIVKRYITETHVNKQSKETLQLMHAFVDDIDTPGCSLLTPDIKPYMSFKSYKKQSKETKEIQKREWRHMYKTMWEEERRKQIDTRCVEIERQKKYAMFDIETSFKPHSKDVEYITCIHLIVFSVDVVYLNETFLLKASGRSSEDFGEQLKHGVQQLFTDKTKTPIVNFVLSTFDSETDLLQSFLQRIKEHDCFVVSHFNGTKFDMPFLFKRLKNDLKDRPYYVPISFSNYPDRCHITYTFDSKKSLAAQKKREWEAQKKETASSKNKK
jgi:uncharacterized protein YprB with RNaseH-like and TPR domain